ncbi:flagellar protein FliT [Arsenophonus nasoniae]|uniref:Flagellar protein FliT n=1 Tax=Arsenophonus nasoniae TaxID=638 RepID=A0A4P7KSN2_9GAMM|nr:flagellar protein FliT [Arsenophonus nasoniae]QBY42971.1 Flagellar protein FliT [Arsenophonus nasoniae]WGM07016.1 flagellar protein FliT [Arsenophonus nasoniae]WGM11896.1 flagellar protein FliT [Arsenophonus nasoniae]WGM16580.1 flagellar protein FliT [Arsenophonus nasoniae]
MNSEHQPFLSAYQHLLTISQQMLALAQLGQWEQLLVSEKGYQQAVEQVTALGSIAGLSKPLSHQLTELLQAILTNENAIRQLMERQMNELAQLIKQTAQQQQLQSRYGEFE